MPRMTIVQLKSKYFQILNEEWGHFIDSACWTEARFHHDPMLDHDDLKQDVLEYIYRYTFKAVRERSKKGQVWVPYLRNSIRNCFVNIRKSKKNWRIRLDMVNADATDLHNLKESEGMADNFVDPGTNIEDDFEYAEYCREVASMLNDQEKMVLYAILNPSFEFSAFIKKQTLGRAKTNVTKKMVSEFFGLSYGTVIATYKKFQSTIELCNAAV